LSNAIAAWLCGASAQARSRLRTTTRARRVMAPN
jgi:hypothetical protein